MTISRGPSTVVHPCKAVVELCAGASGAAQIGEVGIGDVDDRVRSRVPIPGDGFLG